MAPRHATLAELCRAQGAALGDAVALRYGGDDLSYAEFDARASRVAQGLLALGLEPGTRIASLMKNNAAFYELLFGASKAGMVLVPVNWRLAPPEIEYIVKDSGAEALFVGAEYRGLAAGLLDRLPGVATVISIDGPHGDSPGYADWRDGQRRDDPGLPLRGEDTVVQMYTSGTTGHPKGTELTNANLTLEVEVGADGMNWSDRDVSLVVMPQFHIAGTAWGLIGLSMGARNVVLHDVDPAEILRLIERERVTRMFVVPAVILFMLQTPGCAETDFSSLDRIVYGASPINEGLLRQAQATIGCHLVQVYGLTETTGAITLLSPEDHRSDDPKRLLSCGRPLRTVELRVVDPEGNDLPPGEVGEVICRTPLNMKGYFNNPEATAKALRDGWFHTGDAGYLDADGYLYIHDRVKDMIVSGGENIYPAEVESAIFDHPGVADVAVIGVPDPKWGETVKAIVVRAPDADVDERAIVDHAAERIARYKLPTSVDFVDELPRNPSGKILKRELRKPFWEGQGRAVG